MVIELKRYALLMITSTVILQNYVCMTCDVALLWHKGLYVWLVLAGCTGRVAGCAWLHRTTLAHDTHTHKPALTRLLPYLCVGLPHLHT